jgi:glucuronosyltransferase
MSKLYLDRPMSAMDTAIFWAEYVIRHSGAPELRPAILDLAWYQYMLLDILAAFLLCIITVVFLVYFFTRKLVKMFTLPHRQKSKQS